MRNGINRKLDLKRSFAIYRVEAPWFSHTKKGIGKRMGGGMGNISYYSTPVKAKRVILEVAGMVTFEEVERMLRIVAHKLPFPAAVMTQEMIEKQREEEKRLEKENENRFTFKYIVQNNMMGSRFWAKKELDLKYFGKYD
ncbi:39S ribosomal protein L16, mitochondrial [Armadillidium vulgare]|nr:39S ribosomal protein L16, mitochondrial [Armadillidium vulgare]